VEDARCVRNLKSLGHASLTIGPQRDADPTFAD
jgi:hypothetical protein